MIRILFVCHGNICRSAMAEYVMKDMVEKAGLEDQVYIESAATSTEEIGNGVYPPVKRLLNSAGIDCSGHRAHQMRKDDYGKFDLIIGMDLANLRSIKRITDDDPAGKIHLLSEYYMDSEEFAQEVDDPWYTRNFNLTWEEVNAGCRGLLSGICRCQK